MEADPAVIVPALLAAAGLTPSAEEVALMIADHPGRAVKLDALYAVPEARYEEPALVFGSAL
jgi:hypothetical protein